MNKSILVGICCFVLAHSTFGIELLVDVRVVDSAVEMTWQSETGEWYRVVSKSSLTENINKVSLPIVASNTTESFSALIDEQAPYQFYNVIQQGIGSTILFNGAVTNNQEVLAAVRPNSLGCPVELFVLLDVTGGVTNIIDTVYGTNITEALFNIDTFRLPNGDRQIVAVAYDGTDNSTEYCSDSVTISVDNKIFLAPNQATSPGWKLVVQFGSSITKGTYLVNISAIQGDTTNLYGTVSGDLSETDTNGFITVEDSYVWDESINDYRYRDPYDSYDGIDQFEIDISVNEQVNSAGFERQYNFKPPWKVKYRVTPTPPRRWRISSVIEDTAALDFVEGSMDHTIMDGLFDLWFMRLAYISLHWDFIRENLESDQLPGQHGWTRFDDTSGWNRFNWTLAHSANVPIISHMYLFMHGKPAGVRDRWEGSGIDHEVTPATLTSLGFSKTNGLTFAFFDACSVFEGSAVLPNLVMRNGGVEGHISLGEMFEKGIHPNYSCGWTDPKMNAFARRVYLDHIDYSADYLDWVINPSPTTGLPLYSYREARKHAKEGNLSGRNYGYTGVEEAFIHW